MKKEYQKNVQEIMDNIYDKKSPLLYANPIRQDYREYAKNKLVEKHK